MTLYIVLAEPITDTLTRCLRGRIMYQLVIGSSTWEVCAKQLEKNAVTGIRAFPLRRACKETVGGEKAYTDLLVS